MPTTNQQEQSCFAELDPFLLSKILCYLSFADRLVASEVCWSWHTSITSFKWTEITRFSLESTPRDRIVPVLRRCPNVTELDGHSLDISSKLVQKAIETIGANLQTLKFYNCKQLNIWECFTRANYEPWRRNDVFDYSFGPKPICFVWHCDLQSLWGTWCHRFKAYPGNNIVRLQLSGFSVIVEWQHLRDVTPNLPNLESLVLACAIALETTPAPSTDDLADIFKPLMNLKDVCIAFVGADGDEYEANIPEAVAIAARTSWPKIELIWFAFRFKLNQRGLLSLTGHISTLKILVLADCPLLGRLEDAENAMCGQQHLQRVFCVAEVAQYLWSRSFRGSVTIVPGNTTSSQFLSIQENACLFKNYWVAQMVAEAPLNGFEVGVFQHTENGNVLGTWPFGFELNF